MENVLVAITNVPCFIPIVSSLKQEDYVTTACILFVSLASIVSHLFDPLLLNLSMSEKLSNVTTSTECLA